MNESARKKFTTEDLQRYIEDAEQNENVLGFFMGGSRGKGFEDAYSDWDLRYVVKIGTKAQFSKQPEENNFEDSEYADMSTQVFDYDEFRQHAEWKTAKAWDRYSFSHVTTYTDKTGDIQTLIEEKCKVPADEQLPLIKKHMDAYVHDLFRSMKALRRGDALGAQIHATFSVYNLSIALFAVELRTAPYHSYLARELTAHPLQNFPVTSKELLGLLEKVVFAGNAENQQQLAKVVEKYMRGNGHYDYVRWASKYEWLMGYSAK
jgi:hypothetical protein